MELLPADNIAYSNTYGLIYTFSSLLLILLFVHHVKDRFPLQGSGE